MPDNGTQAEASSERRTGVLGGFLDGGKGYGGHFQPLNWEIQMAREGGCDVHIVSAFGKVADPVGGNGGAGVNNKKYFHVTDLIFHSLEVVGTL